MGIFDLFHKHGKVVYQSVSLLDPKVVKDIKKRCIVFDTETTGLDPEYERIIEIGAILYENGRPIAKFNTLVNSKKEVSKEASAVNHITNEMVKKAPSEEVVYAKFVHFLGNALKGETVIVGHNSNFDIRFLSKTLERLDYNGKILYADTLPLARNRIRKSEIQNYKQVTLAKYLNITQEHAHRADSDAFVCGQILFKLLNMTK